MKSLKKVAHSWQWFDKNEFNLFQEFLGIEACAHKAKLLCKWNRLSIHESKREEMIFKLEQIRHCVDRLITLLQEKE